MLAKVPSVALLGMDARLIEVEVSVSGGSLPQFHIVGLPSTGIREAGKRVEAAVSHSGSEFPKARITVNLAPGDVRKDGSFTDLPMAIGVLAATGQMKATNLSRYLFLGELGLDGRLRPVRGALIAAMCARDKGLEGVVLPWENSREASLVPGLRVAGVRHLIEAAAFASGELQEPAPLPPAAGAGLGSPTEGFLCDMSQVKGQALARRALEIAAAGDHNVLMIGPPGSGKTMLAKRLPGILPLLSGEESLEVTRVWSVAGLLDGEVPLRHRPFRSPHHHASPAAVLGGGSLVPRPGEVSLAHRGVLFLDEFPLFGKGVLESLRQPLEEGSVVIARRDASVRFPANFMLVAAANPCPCGGDGGPRRPCQCPPGRLDSYRSRLSGPLLDRIDLHVEVARLTEEELMGLEPSEGSAAVRERVAAARLRRAERGARDEPREMLRRLPAPARRFLRRAIENEPTSARAFTRILRVARSIADLDASDEVTDQHVAEALQFRRGVWER